MGIAKIKGDSTAQHHMPSTTFLATMASYLLGWIRCTLFRCPSATDTSLLANVKMGKKASYLPEIEGGNDVGSITRRASSPLISLSCRKLSFSFSSYPLRRQPHMCALLTRHCVHTAVRLRALLDYVTLSFLPQRFLTHY